MAADYLFIHHIEPYSSANGPGLRSVIWTQGCTLHCPGCFNPATHPLSQGKKISLERLFSTIKKYSSHIEGITISGGEPLLQIDGLFHFLKLVKDHLNLSVILFTGFHFNEVLNLPGSEYLKSTVDVMISGRYISSQQKADSLLGSSNKIIHFFSNRYSLADIYAVPPAEVILKPNGSIILSGIRPLRLKN